MESERAHDTKVSWSLMILGTCVIIIAPASDSALLAFMIGVTGAFLFFTGAVFLITRLIIERVAEERTHSTCPECGWTSYNPNDVRERYCGHCHKYIDMEKRVGSVFDIIETILRLIWLIGIVPSAALIAKQTPLSRKPFMKCSMGQSNGYCDENHYQCAVRVVPAPGHVDGRDVITGMVAGMVWPIIAVYAGVLYVARHDQEPEVDPQQVKAREYSMAQVVKITNEYEQALKVGPHAPDNVQLAEELHDTRVELTDAREALADNGKALIAMAAEMQAQEAQHTLAMNGRWLAEPHEVLKPVKPPPDPYVEQQKWLQVEKAYERDKRRKYG